MPSYSPRRTKECDLIVLGSSQRTMTEKMLFGNVVDTVLKHAPCDVVVFSYTSDLKPISYNKILVPTSGYMHATRALDIAIGLEKKFEGSITSMYVGKETEAGSAETILQKVNAMAESYRRETTRRYSLRAISWITSPTWQKKVTMTSSS